MLSGAKPDAKQTICRSLMGKYDAVEFVPPDSMDKTEYDDFCDYVKWKKMSIATITLLLSLDKKGYTNVMPSVTESLITLANEALKAAAYDRADLVLDQLYEIYLQGLSVAWNQRKTYIDDISAFINAWIPKSPDMKPATRFKLYAYVDSLEKTYKNNKWVSKTRSSLT